MARDLDRQRVFTRRSLVLATGKGLLVTAIAGRLYYLQIEEADRLRTLADENRINVRLIPPVRGRIVDREGRPLSDNRQDYRIVIVPEKSHSVSATLDLLGSLVTIRDEDRQRVLREVAQSRSFMPIEVCAGLSWDDIARVEVRALDLPDVTVEDGYSRQYPYGEMLAHVLGYVGAVSERDPIDDPVLRLPGYRIGKSGVERSYDRTLRGTAGASQVEVNAVGRVIRELDRNEPQPGVELELALDLNLQRLAHERLGEESGAVVVLDVQTGEVLALVSSPGFDPNMFGRGVTAKEWRTLITEPKAPLVNKAIAGQYPPGSTFKPVVALAGLEGGAITPSSAIRCSGATQLGATVFHCWRRGGHGALAVRDAIAQSCDCFFYETARRVGVDKIAAIGRKLGLGGTCGIDLPNEKPGLLPTEAWKLATTGKGWTTGESLVAGIGQGYVLTTPLQLALMTARLANGGRAVQPRMLRAADERLAAGGDLGIAPRNLRLVLDGMNAVVNGGGGTAGRSAIREPGFEMGGKTGTSQVRRISMAERRTGVLRNDQLPWEKRDHALFIGYAPVSAPRYACAVIVEHGGGGSKAAAPIARDVLYEVQKLARASVAGGNRGERPA
jgi:penicillin-binding protein 2